MRPYNGDVRPSRQTSRRSAGFRQASLTDRRGAVLAYADRVAVGANTLGLTGVTFAPAVLERLLVGRIPHVIVASGGRPRVELRQLRLSYQAGERRLPEGGWISDAAVGTFRSMLRLTPRRPQS